MVNLTKEGVITVNNETYTKDELRQMLERIMENAKIAGQDQADQQPVRIRCDADGTNQVLFEVMDEIQKAGIWNIRFANRTPTAPPE